MAAVSLISSATSHSDIQYTESLWTISHYVMIYHLLFLLDLITLSGGGRILRSWDPSTGFLRWEAPTTTQAASQEG